MSLYIYIITMKKIIFQLKNYHSASYINQFIPYSMIQSQILNIIIQLIQRIYSLNQTNNQMLEDPQNIKKIIFQLNQYIIHLSQYPNTTHKSSINNIQNINPNYSKQIQNAEKLIKQILLYVDTTTLKINQLTQNSIFNQKRIQQLRRQLSQVKGVPQTAKGSSLFQTPKILIDQQTNPFWKQEIELCIKEIKKINNREQKNSKTQSDNKSTIKKEENDKNIKYMNNEEAHILIYDSPDSNSLEQRIQDQVLSLVNNNTLQDYLGEEKERKLNNNLKIQRNNIIQISLFCDQEDDSIRYKNAKKSMLLRQQFSPIIQVKQEQSTTKKSNQQISHEITSIKKLSLIKKFIKNQFQSNQKHPDNRKQANTQSLSINQVYINHNNTNKYPKKYNYLDSIKCYLNNNSSYSSNFQINQLHKLDDYKKKQTKQHLKTQNSQYIKYKLKEKPRR